MKGSVHEGTIVIVRIYEAGVVWSSFCYEENLPLLWMMNLNFGISIWEEKKEIQRDIKFRILGFWEVKLKVEEAVKYHLNELEAMMI